MLLKAKTTALEKLRKDKNLSQHRLSILAGLSNNAVYRMENTPHKVSDLRAYAIIKVLDCEIKDVFEID